MLPDDYTRLNQRVRVVRDQYGRLVGYQDPDKNNRFIAREEAVKRILYDFDKMYFSDSYNTKILEAEILTPLRGTTVHFVERSAVYTPMLESPNRFRPASNQEVIERLVVVGKDGRVHVVDTSYGLGVRYNENKYGGRWRQRVSEALELPENVRLPTSDLKRAVASVEYIVKTITRRF